MNTRIPSASTIRRSLSVLRTRCSAMSAGSGAASSLSSVCGPAQRGYARAIFPNSDPPTCQTSAFPCCTVAGAIPDSMAFVKANAQCRSGALPAAPTKSRSATAGAQSPAQWRAGSVDHNHHMRQLGNRAANFGGIFTFDDAMHLTEAKADQDFLLTFGTADR